MTTETLNLILLMVSAIAGVSILAAFMLRGWHDWLDLKRLQLTNDPHDVIVPRTGGRIELADLKERVRKLEAIAAGIDL